jgi:GH18 family chitinase|tara:strand:+ start:727 stop:897 length:171 start_codon:yes stop_codon:yes gene_type:complete
MTGEFRNFAKESMKLRERHNKEWMAFLKRYKFGGKIDIVYKELSGVGQEKKCDCCK